MKIVISLFIAMFIVACSDSDTPQKVEGDHVWKEQTDMIGKAKDVEKLLLDSAEQQKQLIDSKTQ